MDLCECFLKCVWLLSLTGHVYTLKEIPGALGGSVYLSAEVTAPENHDIEWTDTSWIARLTPGSAATYQGKCSDRCELFDNGTLRMDKLISSDGGTYDVAFKHIPVTTIHKVQLTVYSLLTAPSLQLSITTRPVNGSNIDLQCTVGSQTISKYVFYQDEQLLSCQLPHINCSQTSPYVYFRPVTEHNSGNYTCVIQNPVSYNSSEPLHINVAVNVSQVTLSNNASSPVLVEKESVALTCSSLGTDLSYSWSLDGEPLPENSRYYLTGNDSILIISPVTRNDVGVFTCTVTNYLNNDTSNPLSLSWSPEDQLKCGVEHLGRSLELSCLWPGGYPAADIQMFFHDWSKTGQNQISQILPLEQVLLGTELSCTGRHWGPNETCSLSIDTPQCEGFINNSLIASAQGSSIVVSVPLTSRKPGLSMHLPAMSPAAVILPAKFTWYKLTPEPLELFHGGNITIISNEHTSLLAVLSMTNDMVGNYMCSAENLMGTTYFAFTLNIPEEKGSCDSNSLSPGAIAGIVIGVLAIYTLIIIIIIYNKNITPFKKTNKKSVDNHHFARSPEANAKEGDDENPGERSHGSGRNNVQRNEPQPKEKKNNNVPELKQLARDEHPSTISEHTYEAPNINRVYTNMDKRIPTRHTEEHLSAVYE